MLNWAFIGIHHHCRDSSPSQCVGLSWEYLAILSLAVVRLSQSSQAINARDMCAIESEECVYERGIDSVWWNPQSSACVCVCLYFAFAGDSKMLMTLLNGCGWSVYSIAFSSLTVNLAYALHPLPQKGLHTSISSSHSSHAKRPWSPLAQDFISVLHSTSLHACKPMRCNWAKIANVWLISDDVHYMYMYMYITLDDLIKVK